MKSDRATDREIKLVADIINNQFIGTRGSKEYAVAFAIYETVRWCRGLR